MEKKKKALHPFLYKFDCMVSLRKKFQTRSSCTEKIQLSFINMKKMQNSLADFIYQVSKWRLIFRFLEQFHKMMKDFIVLGYRIIYTLLEIRLIRGYSPCQVTSAVSLEFSPKITQAWSSDRARCTSLKPNI